MQKAIFVAHTAHLAKMAESCAQESSVNCDVVYKALDEIDEPLDLKDYQLVIAYGDYAQDLKAQTDLTILEINPDFVSLLQDIESLIAIGKKQIFVISDVIDLDFELKTFKLADAQIIFTKVSTKKEAVLALAQARAALADGSVGSIDILKLAQGYKDLTAIPFSLSKNAILKTMKAAKRILHLEKVKRLQLTRLDLLINNIQEGILIFNLSKETVFSNVQADSILKGIDKDHYYDFVSPYFKESTDVNKVIELNGHQVLMQTKHFIFPQTDIDNYVVIIQAANEIEKQEHTLRKHTVSKGLIAKATFSSMCVNDKQTKEIVETAKRFATTDSTVLICGETGVGKEILAQSIHNASSRKAEPFVSVNCASLPPSLIESELFGYAEGAFTGARAKGKKGLFELAHRGTIFLDEIGELPIDIQALLLRVLQEREVMRIGDDKVIPLDVRVICATNRHLMELCEEGKFRLDLYYRINVLRLRVPALRDRKDDIIPLFKLFLTKAFGHERFSLSDKAQAFLLNQPWRGNIRELRNVAEACVLYGNEIKVETLEEITYQKTLDDDKKAQVLPFKQKDNLVKVDDASLVLDLKSLTSLKDAEKKILEGMLQHYSIQDLCKKLGLSRVTLWRKLKGD